MNPLVILTLIATLLAPDSVHAPDAAPAPAGSSVAIPQSFIEHELGFRMLGQGLAASLETGRIRWIVTDPDDAARRSLVTIEPVGGRSDVAPEGQELLAGVVSRFSGDPSEWHAGRRTFRKVSYAGLWDGIDLVLEARGQTLKGTYLVAPGADPTVVRMRHRGAETVTIDADGRLIVKTASGDLIDAAPVAWQQIDGTRHDVPVAFALEAAEDGAIDVAFNLGAHDPTAPLLIDPAVIVQAGFLGGADKEFVTGVAVDDAGFLYVAGYTLSSEATFPVLVGPELVWQGAPSTTQGDAFVAKIDPTGNTLVYAGFIGGTNYDFAQGLAVDSLGRAYVGGHTGSTENAGFPVNVGPSLTHSGDSDAWVARVSADGMSLDYCGYIGGNFDDRVFGLDVDDSFRVHVVGRFKSLPSTLPLTVGPSLVEPGGPTDSFIARLSPSGSSLQYCGYLGGNSFDDITNVAVDDLGGAWFAGWTGSPDFPVVGTLGTTYNGAADVVIGRVSPDGTTITSCGFVGTTTSEYPFSLVVDDNGSPYIGGLTLDAFTFPVVVGPNLVPSGASEGFLMKLAPDGESIEWSGFTGTGFSGQMVVDGDETAWVTTYADDGTPAGTGPVLGRVAQGGTVFETLATIAAGGNTSLPYIDLVPSALTPGVTEIWLAGTSTDDETTFPVVTGPDITANGLQDAVVVRLQVTDDPWTDLGFALAGTHGDPVLAGIGTLGPLSPLELSLSNALENTTAWLVFGLSTIYAPFKGGVMVPGVAPPSFIISLPTSPLGDITILDTWPNGVPSGFSIYLQYWIQDAAAVVGFAASNGLQGTTP